MRFNQMKSIGFGCLSLLGTLSQTHAAVSCNTSSMAEGNFAILLQVTGNNNCETAGAAKLDDLVTQLKNLSSVGGGSLNYTDTSGAAINFRYNGLLATATFAANSNTMVVNIPALNKTLTFNGSSRTDSVNLFKDELVKNGLLADIDKFLAGNAPNSGYTGVTGTMPAAATAAYNDAMGDVSIIGKPSTATTAAGGSSTVGNNLIGAGISIGSFSSTDANGVTTKSKIITLPLSYTIRNDLDPRRQYSIAMPITLGDVGGAKTYGAALGLTYKLPINDNWSIAPTGRVSLLGSSDLGMVSGSYNLGVTSVYAMEFDGFSMAIGNMLNLASSIAIKYKDFNYNPDIKSTMMRNGVMISKPVELDGRRFGLEFSVVDSRVIAGVKPYANGTQEFGVTLGTNKNALSSKSFLRGGVTLYRNDATKGITFNAGYWF